MKRALIRAVLTVALVSAGWPALAHEGLGADQIGRLLIRIDRADAAAVAAADGPARARALVALGDTIEGAVVQLNVAYRAHGPGLDLASELLLGELERRGHGPAFDTALGRYRRPTAAYRAAIQAAPASPAARTATFHLIVAEFEDGYHYDPLAPIGLDGPAITRRLARAEAFLAAESDPERARRVALIAAVNRVRGALAAADPAIRHGLRASARRALAALAAADTAGRDAAVIAYLLAALDRD